MAWTSSRTPGTDSSAPSSSTVIRCVSRPTRCSSGATAASRVGSVRAATHSSRAAVNTGEAKWSPSICSTARVRRGPVGSACAAAASSAPRTSVRCSTAATTRSFLVGKWCSWAPRETPARSETRVVEVRGEAALDQAVDGGLQEPGPHRAGALLLGNPGRGGHRAHPARRTNKQSSLSSFRDPAHLASWSPPHVTGRRPDVTVGGERHAARVRMERSPGRTLEP